MTKEEFEELYLNQFLTLQEIADLYKSTRGIMARIKENYNIPTISRFERTKKKIIGKRFGKLIILMAEYKKTERKHNKKTIYCSCLCDCGNKTNIELDSLQKKNLLILQCVSVHIVEEIMFLD